MFAPKYLQHREQKLYVLISEGNKEEVKALANFGFHVDNFVSNLEISIEEISTAEVQQEMLNREQQK